MFLLANPATGETEVAASATTADNNIGTSLLSSISSRLAKHRNPHSQTPALRFAASAAKHQRQGKHQHQTKEFKDSLHASSERLPRYVSNRNHHHPHRLLTKHAYSNLHRFASAGIGDCESGKPVEKEACNCGTDPCEVGSFCSDSVCTAKGSMKQSVELMKTNGERVGKEVCKRRTDRQADTPCIVVSTKQRRLSESNTWTKRHQKTVVASLKHTLPTTFVVLSTPTQTTSPPIKRKVRKFSSVWRSKKWRSLWNPCLSRRRRRRSF